MQWTVTLTGQARKNQGRLPARARHMLDAFTKKLELLGPRLETWRPDERQKYKNYSLLKGNLKGNLHCHLNAHGKPAYVVCWRVKNNKTVEVWYAGTHEKAPYG